MVSYYDKYWQNNISGKNQKNKQIFSKVNLLKILYLISQSSILFSYTKTVQKYFHFINIICHDPGQPDLNLFQ